MLNYAHESEEVSRRVMVDLQLCRRVASREAPIFPAMGLVHHVGIFSIIHRVAHQERLDRLLCEGSGSDISALKRLYRLTQCVAVESRRGKGYCQSTRTDKARQGDRRPRTVNSETAKRRTARRVANSFPDYAGGLFCSRLTTPARVTEADGASCWGCVG